MEHEDFVYLWPTHLQQYHFCPRFVYFFHVLAIPEFEENRFKVQLGRELHHLKLATNPDYLRKKLKVIRKLTAVPLSSRTLRLKGEVDEVLFFRDGSAAPLDYKFAEWKGKLYKTLRFQSMVYAVLIEDVFQVPVTRGYIVYTCTGNHLETIDFPRDKRVIVQNMVERVFSIIDDELLPEPTSSRKQCLDCTYRKICVPEFA